MAPPPVTIYITSLTSGPKVRRHIELLHRSLRGLDIPYEAFDLVNEPEAKQRWQRAKPPGAVIGLPGYLVGGQWVGTMDDFEEAVETATLPQFLKQDIDLPTIPSSTSTSLPSSSTHAKDGSASTSTSEEEVGHTSQSIQDYELEKLMREMTDTDLDNLAAQLDISDPSTTSPLSASAGKVGLMVAPAESLEEVRKLDLPAPETSSRKGEEEEKSVVEKVVHKVQEVGAVVGDGVVKVTSVFAGISEEELKGREKTADEVIAEEERAEGKEKVD